MEEERKVCTSNEVRRTNFVGFEQLLEEARERTGGDEDKQLDYVTEKVIIEFCHKVAQEKTHGCIDCGKFSKQLGDEGGEVLKRQEEENNVESNKYSTSSISEEEGKQCVKKNQKKGRKIYDLYEQQQQDADMPIEYRNNIEAKMGAKATDINLVISKRLFASELSKQQNRFSIPYNQLLAKNFLTRDEEEELKQRDQCGHCRGIDVVFIDPCFKVRTDICLKKWEINASSSYALTKGWNSIIRDNQELKKSTKVELWSFRVSGQLGFQLLIKS